jgi:hypothetical protein
MLLAVFGIMAQSRSASEAMTVAKAFFSKQGGLRASEQLSLVYTSKSSLRGTADRAYFYVFNRGDRAGFVIVSADERAKEVLGYADAGAFNPNSLPANLRSWLTFYETELELLGKPATANAQAAPLKDAPALRATAIKPSVPPLVQARWDQNDPYDIYTPTIPNGPKTPTGCVATAISQIMRYHSYPAKGRGSHSYTSKTFGFNLSADFNTTYDWANMPYIYDENSTAVQREAVAKLISHVGIAFDMDYDDPASGGSGTLSEILPDAMVTYFDYDSTIQLLYRDHYSYANWINILKTELSESRPVYYGGVTAIGGGHAFVCDGYDTNDMFHINWGWGGSSDGYFGLSALNPSSHGTGGSSGGFNGGQDILINIKPDAGGKASSTLSYTYIAADKTSLATLSETFSVEIGKFAYMGYTPKTISLGIAVCKPDKTILGYIPFLEEEVPAYAQLTLPPQEVALSDEISAGTYHIYPAYRDENSGESAYLLKMHDIGIPYLELTVGANKSAAIKQATQTKANLARTAFAAAGELFPNINGSFTASISNSGNADYRSKLKVEFQGQDFALEEPVVIPAGESKEVAISGTIGLAPGTYTATLLYDKNDSLVAGSSDFAPLGAAIQVTVGPLPELVIVSPPSFPNINAVDRSAPQLKIEIGNAGGRFEGTIIALIFPVEGDEILAQFPQPLTLAKDESKEVVFNQPIDLEPGTYMVGIGLVEDGAYAALVNPITFTLTAPSSTDKAGLEAPRAAFDASYGRLLITSAGTVRKVQLYSITGRLAAVAGPNAGAVGIDTSNLAAGTYIARIETDKGVVAVKLYKRR